MQAALGLARAGPPSVTLRLAGKDGPGARRASDARIAAVEERMSGNTVTLHVAEGVAGCPADERVHLKQPTSEGFEHANPCTAGALVASTAIDPGTHAGEITLERLHLVDMAAEVRVARVKVEPVPLGEFLARHDGMQLGDLDSKPPCDFVAVRQGFRKMETRVHENHRHARGNRAQHVGERHAVVLEGTGENHVGLEGVPRPGENRLRGSSLEIPVEGIEVEIDLWRQHPRSTANTEER